MASRSSHERKNRGIAGIRTNTGTTDRPLVCAVLKPLRISPTTLAELAQSFVLGSVAIIKDDQGLGDHAFCPFKERIRRCITSIRDASRSGEDRIREMCELYGRGCVFILGSQIRESPKNIAVFRERFMRSLTKCSDAH